MYTTQPVRRRRHPTTGQWSPYSSPRLVLYTTQPVRRRRHPTTGQWSPYSSPMLVLYTTQPVRRRRHPATGQWSPYSSPRLVLYTTPPVRRRGGTRRLGSDLHTIRPGLYCIRLHQLGGRLAPDDWAVISVFFAKVCNLEKKLLWRTPLSFETEGCRWTGKSCSTGQHFSALRLIVICGDITSHHSDGHLHCTVTGRPSNKALRSNRPPVKQRSAQ